jgi:hypothetical protein
MEKGGKALKEQDIRNSSQKDKVAKIRWSVLDSGGSDFSITDRVRLEFVI